jgi:hypothetical protein
MKEDETEVKKKIKINGYFYPAKLLNSCGVYTILCQNLYILILYYHWYNIVVCYSLDILTKISTIFWLVATILVIVLTTITINNKYDV